MSKNRGWVRAWVIVLCGLLTTLGARADEIYSNGDFEDDAHLVPNPGDTAAGLPTGWRYDDYYGYSVHPELVNVSAIGDGSGGTVGVRFPNWNDQRGWDAAITRYDQLIAPGHYTFSITVTGEGLTSAGNWLKANVYRVSDPLDPWANGNYSRVGRIGWVELDASDNGVWQTYSVSFEILPGDRGIGDYFAPWIRVQNYNGNIIVGEARLVAAAPEPGTLLLLGTGMGMLGLVRLRRRGSKPRNDA